MSNPIRDIIEAVDNYHSLHGYLPTTIHITKAQWDAIYSLQPPTLGYIVDSHRPTKIMDIPVVLSDTFALSATEPEYLQGFN